MHLSQMAFNPARLSLSLPNCLWIPVLSCFISLLPLLPSANAQSLQLIPAGVRYMRYDSKTGRTLTLNTADSNPIKVVTTKYFVEFDPNNPDAIEGGKVGAHVATFSVEVVNDPTNINPMAKNVTFHINETSNPGSMFDINPVRGIVSVKKNLDREACAKCDRYNLVIVAKTESGLSGHARVLVNVLDINDNAPFLKPNQTVVMENLPAGTFIGSILGWDPDNATNGPPFKFQQAGQFDLFDVVFDQTLDNGNGGFNISTKVVFDREQQKSYLVPIICMDNNNSKPGQMSATRQLRVVIGDVNDNPMSDGYKEVHVYNYMGLLPQSSMGTVYVQDLDDWDIGGKKFTWPSAKPKYFSVAEMGGEMFVEEGTPAGNYQFTVNVADDERKETAVGTVNVTVHSWPEKAFRKSGSVRIKNLSAETLLNRTIGDSPLEKFRIRLAGHLRLKPNMIDIFSVIPIPYRWPKLVDIWYSAISYDNFYRDRITLNSIVDLYRTDFEGDLGSGAQIVEVGVNACLDTACTTGCINDVTANSTATTINANSTSLVGVTVKTNAICDSCRRATVPTTCTSDSCFNNGACHSGEFGFFCECRNLNNRGPRCEGLARSFDGSASALFAPISGCYHCNVSLQFRTNAADGILFYNGPIHKNSSEFDSDHLIVLYLSGGNLVLQWYFGSDTGLVTVNRPLNDAFWHTVDIHQDAQVMTMLIDKGIDIVVTETANSSIADVSLSKASGRTQLGKMYGTFTGPLQVGGLQLTNGTAYPDLVKSLTGFNGCIRQLRVNGELYDFARPAIDSTSTMGCGSLADACSKAGCVHGDCAPKVASATKKFELQCLCDPGYHGNSCDKKSTWMNFDTTSSIQYEFKDNRLLSPNLNDIKLLFATSAFAGPLATGSNTDASEYETVKLTGDNVTLQYNAGGGHQYRTVPDGRQLAPGWPYFIQASRLNEFASLRLDNLNGEFELVQFSSGIADTNQDYRSIDFSPTNFYLGNHPNSQQASFKGCLAEFYWNDLFIPISPNDENVTYAKVVSRHGVTDGCPLITSCLSGKTCPAGMFCKDFWKGAFCTCPDGQEFALNPDTCQIQGCSNYLSYMYLGITSGALIAILICLAAFLILVLVLIVYVRQRRPVLSDRQGLNDDRGRIVDDREEGGGERDQPFYDKTLLQKPIITETTSPVRQQVQPELPTGRTYRPKSPPDDESVGPFIQNAKEDIDLDPTAAPFDEIRPFGHEGDGMTPRGSVSSLESGMGSDVDWDETLNGWGPRFRGLADMYKGSE